MDARRSHGSRAVADRHEGLHEAEGHTAVRGIELHPPLPPLHGTMTIAAPLGGARQALESVRARVGAPPALVLDPARQLRRVVDVESVQERAAVLVYGLLEVAVAQRSSERRDVAGQRAIVEPHRFAVDRQHVRTEVVPQRVDELRERMPAAGDIAFGPEQRDELFARDRRAFRGRQIGQQRQAAPLAVRTPERCTVALEIHGSERSQPQGHMAFDDGRKPI